ncbi:hypothetical protein BK662_11600 [Pseudomonas frederiksbergensis]|uniref:Uncharacterized protein n=1 Tax=Pseudomonas frederiksbergensis TaxID=104087 RepID=A0A423HSB4_9PSED|nr:hypothetical protein BK662_11600 [Pseudomonas frederiksbergensis]
MDRASAKLSRAKSALSMATKAGMEATRGELLDMIATALEQIEEADTELRGGENQDVLPGRLIPAEDLTPCQAVVLPLAASNKAL